MSIPDRIILTLYTILMAVVAVFLVLFSLGVIPTSDVASFAATMPGRWEYAVGGVVLLLVSLRLLIAGLGGTGISTLSIGTDKEGKIHETDFTLADFAADMRAATPSAAAEIVVSDSNTLVDKVSKLVQRNIRSMEHLLVDRQGQLKSLQRSWVFTQPYRFLEDKRLRVDRAHEQLNGNLEKKIVGTEHALSILQAKLETLSPLAILTRGYTVTEKTNGKLAKSVKDLENGEQITTRFFDGAIIANVVNTMGKADN